jgi:uncharacterized RDD family membrane protein YckC
MPDEILTIETPERVELQFALAGVGNRFIACAIDHALQFMAIAIVSLLAYNLNAGARRLGESLVSGVRAGDSWVVALLILASFVIFFGYFTYFETRWNGQTPGKRWLRLRVIQADGRPAGFLAVLTRNLLRLADMLPPPFYSLGIISIFASARAQRLGDFVADTVVIKERAAAAPDFNDVINVLDTALRRVAPVVDFRGDVRVVSPAEITVVEQFLRRRFELPEHPRRWLAWRIAEPLLAKVRPTFDPKGFNYEGFLEELLARHRVQSPRGSGGVG